MPQGFSVNVGSMGEDMSDLNESASAVSKMSQGAKNELKKQLGIEEQRSETHQKILAILLAVLLGVNAFGAGVVWFTLFSAN